MALDLSAWPRDRALALMHEYTRSEALRRHMYAVEVAMRAMAERAGEDPHAWGLVGLLHDFDYERFPNADHAADRACALVRPSRSLTEVEVSSVKKKLKDKGFARGVSRDDVHRGAEELGVPLDEHIAFLLDTLRPHERTFGLGGG
jgi:predicted hydrolase (HD superfamily)